MCRNANRLILEMECPEKHGWSEDESIMWSQDFSPEDIDECLQEAADDTTNQDFTVFEDEYDLDGCFCIYRIVLQSLQSKQRTILDRSSIDVVFEYCDVITRDRKFRDLIYS